MSFKSAFYLPKSFRTIYGYHALHVKMWNTEAKRRERPTAHTEGQSRGGTNQKASLRVLRAASCNAIIYWPLIGQDESQSLRVHIFLGSSSSHSTNIHPFPLSDGLSHISVLLLPWPYPVSCVERMFDRHHGDVMEAQRWTSGRDVRMDSYTQYLQQFRRT